MATNCTGFPVQRVERVLKREGLCNRKDQVKSEGPFIQLSGEGLPERQVFLGITSAAFVVVIQEIPSFSTKIDWSEDLEVRDLALSQVLPLQMVQFFIVDDRAKRFTVCTSFGYLMHYEMCQLDTNFELDWCKWRQTLVDISGDGACLFGYKSWNSRSPASNRHHKKDTISSSMAHVHDTDRPFYVHRPITFHQVRSVGVQVSHETTEVPATVYTGNDAFVLDPAVDSDDSDASASSRTSITLGTRMSGRLAIFSVQTATWNLSVADLDNDHVVPDRCASWSNVGTLDEDTSTNKISCHDLKLLKKKQKRPITISYRRPEFVSDSDSDDDVDDVVDEVIAAHNEGQGRRGMELWKTVQHLVLGTRQKPGLKGNQFGQIVFMSLGEQVKKPVTSIICLKPTDVSSELTGMFVKLLTNLRVTDIQHYIVTKGARMPARLAMVLRFGDNVSKMVATEILQGTTVWDRVIVIKHFVEVCVDLLFNTHDFLTLVPVLRGLTSLPVYRLDDTWATFFVEEPVAYRKFLCIMKIVSPERKYVAYAHRIRMLQSRDVAFLPWLDHFLWHCKVTRVDLDLSDNKRAVHVTKKNGVESATVRLKSMIRTKATLNVMAARHRKQDAAHLSKDESGLTSDISPLKPILIKKRRWVRCPVFEKNTKQVKFALDYIDTDDEKKCDTVENIENTKKTTEIVKKRPVSMAELRSETDISENRSTDLSGLGSESPDMPVPLADRYNIQAIDRYSQRLSTRILSEAMLDSSKVCTETSSGESGSDSGHESDEIDTSSETSDGETGVARKEAASKRDEEVQHIRKSEKQQIENEHPTSKPQKGDSSCPLSQSKSDQDQRKTSVTTTQTYARAEKKRNDRIDTHVQTIVNEQKTSKFYDKKKIQKNEKTEIMSPKMLKPDQSKPSGKQTKVDGARNKSVEKSSRPTATGLKTKPSDQPKTLFQKMLETSSVAMEMSTQPRPGPSPGGRSRWSDVQQRRKSLFEENARTSDDEQDDTDTFEILKYYKLNSMKKRGSVALALLSDGDDGTAKDTNPLFQFQKNESNNSRQNTKKPTDDKSGEPVMADIKGNTSDTVSKSASTEALHISSEESCYMCGKGKCVYSPDKRKDLVLFQNGSRRIRYKSRCRVKEFIQNTVEVNSFLSEYDILQISLSHH